MNFSTPNKVNAVIDQSEEVDRLRGLNRIKVNELFDGFPPMAKEAAQKINLRVNVNWMEGKVIEQQACRQYYTAFTRQNNYFKVFLPSAPLEKRADWELQLTRFINEPMKRSRKYFELIRAKFASVVRHGVGPQIWYNREDWLPDFVAIEDLRLPTDTETSMDNTMWFAVRQRYTPGELAIKAFGRNADPGWKKDIISKILKKYENINSEQLPYDWYTSPEKMLDLYKQDLGYYMSDAVPSMPVWQFYYLDNATDPKNACWKSKVVPADYGIHGVERNTFLYESEEDFGSELAEILHIQFGDLSGKPPFMYHAVRSLGLLLMEPCFWMNLTRCRLVQHVWENFNMLLRGGDPADRARSQKVELFDRGWVPNDVQIVPKDQRHQVDTELVNFVMTQMKQLMGEASAAYTQDVDQGTRKERTAFEVMTLMQSVNQMLSGLLNTAFQYEAFAYREIGRRFCIKDSKNKDVQKFWMKCKRAGIPQQYLNVGLWDIQPDVPLGSGNQTIELAQAKQLMESRTAYSGEAQNKILHLFTAAITNNADTAQDLVPLEEGQNVNDSQRDSEFAFGTLMQGVPVRMKQGLNPIDQANTLLGLMAGVVSRIEKTGGTSTMQEVSGLNSVGTYIGQLIQQLSQDPAQKPLVKQLGEMLGELMNQVKAFQQRLQQEMASKQKENISINYKDAPQDIQRQMEAAAGFQPSQMATDPNEQKEMKAAHGMKLKQDQAQQKMQLAEQAHQAEQQRENAAAQSDLQRTAITTAAQLDMQKQKTDASIEAQKKAAGSKPKAPKAPKKE